jgi:hypothetical protein
MEQQQELQQTPQGMQPMLGPDPSDLGGSYYQPENDLTGGLPINLDSLRDGPPGSKPFYPYSTLIRWVVILRASLDTKSNASCFFVLFAPPFSHIIVLPTYQLCHQRIPESKAVVGRYLLCNRVPRMLDSRLVTNDGF